MISDGVALTATDLEATKLTNIRNKCNSVLQGWSPVGLKSDLDRASIMYRGIAPFSPTKEVIIKCLGSTYAYAAFPYQGKSHFDLPADWQFTTDDIDRYVTGNEVINKEFGLQPQGWSKLFETINYVGDRAGRELRGEQASEFYAKFATALKVEDETANYPILKELDSDNQGVSFEAPPQEVFAKLRTAGYGRWACIVETDSASGSVFKSSRNEAVIALIYKVRENEPLTSNEANAIRVLFKDKRIRSVVFTDYFVPDDYVKKSAPRG